MNRLRSSNHVHGAPSRCVIGFVLFLLLMSDSKVCYTSPSPTLIFSSTENVLAFFETTLPETVRPEDVLAGIKLFCQAPTLSTLRQPTFWHCTVNIISMFPDTRFALYSQRYFYDSWWANRAQSEVFLENTLRWIEDFPDRRLGMVALDELEKYTRVMRQEDFFSTEYPAQMRAMNLPKGSLTQVAFEAKYYLSTWQLKRAKMLLDSLTHALGPMDILFNLRDKYTLLDMLEGTESTAIELASMIIQDCSTVKEIQQIPPDQEFQRADDSLDDPVTYCERQKKHFELGQFSAEVAAHLYQAHLPGVARRWKEQSRRFLVPVVRAVGFPCQPNAQRLLDELDAVDISSTTEPLVMLDEVLQGYNRLCEVNYPEEMPDDILQLEEFPLESVKHRLEDCIEEVVSSIEQSDKGMPSFALFELLAQANAALKDWDGVVRIVKWAIVNMPSQDAARLTLDSVQVLSSEKQYQRILDLSECFLQQKEDLGIGIEILFAMGQANYQLDRPKEAIGCLEDYLKSDKAGKQLEAEFLKALCLIKLSDYSSASQVLERVAPLMGNRTKVSQALFLAGQCYLLEGRYEEAKRVFEHIVSVYPYSAQASGAEKMLEKLKVFFAPTRTGDK